MKRWLCGGVVCAVTGLASVAAAQTPPSRVGFQMAMRTGYAVPSGNVAQGTKMSDVFGGQVPFLVDIGGKVIPELFIGGYLGLGFGGAGSEVKTICQAYNATCASATFRLGVELAYHILPEGVANPWVGYGVGIESTAVSGDQGGNKFTESLVGFEIAHLMAGVDFRVSRGFGVGPFIDYSIGTYSHERIEATGLLTLDGDITNTASHQWFTAGARFVIFP